MVPRLSKPLLRLAQRLRGVDLLLRVVSHHRVARIERIQCIDGIHDKLIFLIHSSLTVGLRSLLRSTVVQSGVLLQLLLYSFQPTDELFSFGGFLAPWGMASVIQGRQVVLIEAWVPTMSLASLFECAVVGVCGEDGGHCCRWLLWLGLFYDGLVDP